MDISVIIATYNRKDSLKETLDALSRQDFCHLSYEVIVINDGSTDGTVELLEEYSVFGTIGLRFFNQQNQGPAAARNLGIQYAKGRIVAFTDDDCIPSQNWLCTIDAQFKNSNIVGLQGSTFTDKDKITPLTHQIDNTHGNKSVPTCNAAYLKSALDAIGGFDTEFPFPHNEDADLAWRIQKNGEIGFCADMLVYHPPRMDTFTKVSKRMKIMESEFRLFYKDPESYRKNRGPSPWQIIYWEVMVKTQWYYFKTRFKYLKRPKLMFQGLALTFIWWWDLIRFYPKFWNANKVHKKMF